MTTDSAKPGQAYLPAEFMDLAEWIDWALCDDVSRYTKRAETPVDELRRFYDAVLLRLDAIMHHLRKFNHGDSLPVAERNLLNLGRALMQVSHPVELGWRQGHNTEGFAIPRIELPVRA